MFVRDVQQMAQKAAPFLTFDSNPYAVIANGEVQYVLDGYTTTDQYPYSQNASVSTSTRADFPLASTTRATRQSRYQRVHRCDDVLRERPERPDSSRLPLGVPDDVPPAEPDARSRPHAPALPNGPVLGAGRDPRPLPTSRRRAPSTPRPTAGDFAHHRSGTPRQSLARTTVTNNAGNVVSTELSPMSPVYQVGSLPFANHQQLLQTISYVPAGNSTTVQGLTAFMIATSDPDDYGQLHVYVTPRGTSVTGPVQADSEIQQNSQAAQITTLLDQHGSRRVARQQPDGAARSECSLHSTAVRDEHVEPSTAAALRHRRIQPRRGDQGPHSRRPCPRCSVRTFRPDPAAVPRPVAVARHWQECRVLSQPSVRRLHRRPKGVE